MSISLRALTSECTIGGLASSYERRVIAAKENRAGMVPVDYRYCPECGVSLTEGIVDGRLRKHCPQCHFVRYENPLPVVVALAVKDGRFLLIKRAIAPKKGYWGFPSGFVESGETPEEACLRELKEEAGVSGEIQRLIRVGRLEDTELYGDMLVVTYLVNVKSDMLVAGVGEVDDVRYYQADELPGYLSASLRGIIDEVANSIQS